MAEEMNNPAPEEKVSGGEEKQKTGYNYPGIVTGILLIILPFTGKWWHLTLGTDALYIAASPFSLTVLSFGDEIVSPLLTSLTIAAAVLAVIFGIVLIAGSVLTASPDKRGISEILVNSGCLKALFVVVIFLAAVIAAGLAFSGFLSAYGFSGAFPLLYGSSEMAMQSGSILLAIPVNSVISPAFYIAVLAAVCGIAARFFAKR